MAVYWLQVLEPGHPARVVTVDGRLDIGRDGDDVVLDDLTASRHHVVAEPSLNGVIITDNGSANGTFVDGQRIDAPVLAAPGTRIQIGQTEMVVVEGRATEGAAPTGEAAVDPSQRVSEAARELTKAASKNPLGGTTR